MLCSWANVLLRVKLCELLNVRSNRDAPRSILRRVEAVFPAALQSWAEQSGTPSVLTFLATRVGQ